MLHKYLQSHLRTPKYLLLFLWLCVSGNEVRGTTTPVQSLRATSICTGL